MTDGPFARRLRAAMAALAAACACGPVDAAKVTPFGTELVAAHFPNSTAEDTFAALSISAEIGGHSCMTWHWGEAWALPAITTLPPVMRQFGLKSSLQMATTFLGDPSPPLGYEPSFGAAATRQKFLSDAAALAATRPDYLVMTTEVNLMYRFNKPEFDNFASLYREAYHLVKAISPGTKVGASYLYTLWIGNYFIDDIDVPALLTPRDFIAFTSYPEELVRDGHYSGIAEIPAAFYNLSRHAYPDDTIIFPEVGWPSKGRTTPQAQAEFMSHLPRLMAGVRPEIVTWALLYDVEYFTRALLSEEAVRFLEELNIDIDALFLHFNGMGLLDGNGVPKPALEEAATLDFGSP